MKVILQCRTLFVILSLWGCIYGCNKNEIIVFGNYIRKKCELFLLQTLIHSW